MRRQYLSLALLPLFIAGCAPSSTQDFGAELHNLTPTAEESEFMAHVSAEADTNREGLCVSLGVAEVTARGQIGEVTQTAIVLNNRCAATDIPVRAFEFIDVDGAFEIASDVPSLIPAGESVEILVDFEAHSDIIHLAEFRLLLEDTQSPVQIAELYGLVGSSTDRSGDPPDASTGGGAFTTNTGDVTVMDGSSSSDPEDDPLTYRWTWNSLPETSAITDADIVDAEDVTAEFTPDVDGDYRVRLVVSDGTSTDKTFAIWSASSAGEENTAPTAVAGDSLFVTTGAVASLDGSASSDPEGDTLSYAWTLTSPATGSALTSDDLVDADTANMTFTPDVAGYYIVKLQVNDGLFADADFVTVFASDNSAPVPLAGDDQLILLGETAGLDGSASYDVDGDTINYSWVLRDFPAGSALTSADIVDNDQAVASFTPDVAGRYRVRLLVDDGTESDGTSVIIDVEDPVDPCFDDEYTFEEAAECADVWDWNDWWNWLREVLGF